MRFVTLAAALFSVSCGDLEDNRICLNGCLEPTPDCVKYVACYYSTGGTPGALDYSFGKRGTCWTNKTIQGSCDQGCKQALVSFAADGGC